ncbi:TniQ family protein [Actinoallomurus liliacearum]|uniref:TniQ family protein n=1 Tax=Actinoallomurus liliacearum TaxID=1080073 RepID=A0ABP8TX31_9ACTN
MTGWTATRIPITVAPLPGEALDSWLGAYARRLRTTSNGLLDHLGLGSSPMTQMVLRLHEHEATALEQATGVSRQALAAMTLEPFDGLAVAIEPGHRTRLARFPTGRFPGAHARYCPACLARDDGRGPLTWRLPWTFACPQHQRLLLDVCPACQRPPHPWNIRRLGPASTGACTRDNPNRPGTGHRGACGADLTCAPTVRLPATGLVLATYERLAGLLTGPPAARPEAVTALRQIYAVAWRAVRGLHTIGDQAPPIVHAVLTECDAELPDLINADIGRDARSAAIGAALADVALDDRHPDQNELFDWILRADRSLIADRQNKPSVGMLAHRWTWAGPTMVSHVLGRLDRQATLHTRLRYATATPRPRWPDLPTEAITRRATMIPAMLWPSWTMRLLPPPSEAGPCRDDPRTGSFSSFRRGCASFLLLPGAPPQMNYERAAPLLGNHSHDADRGAVEHRIYHDRDLTPLASILTQLAFALDEHGSPIDYARRRALFTDATLTLDLDAYTRLRLQHGWSSGYAPRVAALRWYLRLLLTGEHRAPPDARKPFGHRCTEFRYHAPRPLREFLRQQARANLDRHGIDEPLTWEPPAHWANCPSWPGTDPTTMNEGDVTAVLATTDSIDEAAEALGLTPEHIRLYCEITDVGTPPTMANGLPVSRTRKQVLEPARLRELYEDENLPVTEIAATADCATATIRRLLKHDGVPPRRTYRRPPPESGITRAWLHREYVDKLRSMNALARERGVTANYLMRLAKNWGLPIRHHNEYSGIGHLDLPAPPSPAMHAVTMRTGALNRLAFIIQIPGHASLAAAARAIYDGRDTVLRERARKIENAAGFTIIDRTTTPLTPTQRGREFLHEARQILYAAREV